VFFRDGKPVPLKNRHIELSFAKVGNVRKSTKVTLLAPLHAADLGGLNDHLLRYDEVYAIDTNSVDLGGSRVSVACCMGYRKEVKTNEAIELVPWQAQALELHGVSESPERSSLVRLLHDACQLSDRKIGVIVDCILGDLIEINAKLAPILGNWTLPDNASFI
jgi:hypothetical protein